MNKNPLLIKSALIGKIPFMKNKTRQLYSKYLSNGKFEKILSDHQDLTEILSAYTLNSGYNTDFTFDNVTVENSKFFSEREWIALGMLLRAYAEVEGVKLMHLYNCMYRAETNKVYGHVVTGRTYTLYSSTQLPVNITVRGIYTEGTDKILRRPSLSRNSPFIFKIEDEAGGPERLVEIEVEFTGEVYQPVTLIEGGYTGIVNLSNPILEKSLIPEAIPIGEYSSKLVEFFSGTLVTKLSDVKLRRNLENSLTSEGITLEEKVINATPGWFNKDGYCDRRVKI